MSVRGFRSDRQLVRQTSQCFARRRGSSPQRVLGSVLGRTHQKRWSPCLGFGTLSAMRPDAKQIAERRRCRAAAAHELVKLANFAELVPTYSRMNPRDSLPANVFYFGERNAPPRIVILGPWAYVHAPGSRLPAGFEDFPETERKRKHLGALHARVLLESDRAVRLVRTLAEKLSQAASAPPRSQT